MNHKLQTLFDTSYKHPTDISKYSHHKQEFIQILKKPLWQTARLPLLSDTEGLDRAYCNSQTICYDGNQTLYIAGANSTKYLFINDLTIPLRFIHYTYRYIQAPQLFTENKNNNNARVYHSLGSVIAHHIILDDTHLNGCLYSTPSLAIPHDRIKYLSHHGDPIAMMNLGRRRRTLYLGSPHTHTGY